MNINPYSQTLPHYDSYEDFYKFFEVQTEKIKEGVPVEVFPPVKTEKFFKEQMRKAEEKRKKGQNRLFS